MNAEVYNILFSGTGVHLSDTGHNISRAIYSRVYTLYAFDSTPDFSAHHATHCNLVKNGSLRLETRFSPALPVNVNCIVYTDFDNVLKIDSTRQLITDYNG